MYEGIAKKGLPTRISRWCCERYKEYPADIERGGHVLIGVRAAESVARKKRVLDALGEAGRAEDPQAEERAQLVKPCMQIAGYKIYPIVWWSDNEVWDFIRARRAEYCELYDQGHVRIGCMGCPMDTGGKVDELMRWPWAYAKYRNGARRYAEQRRAAGVGLSSAWPGWEANKAIMRRMEDDGASVEDVARHDERIRKLALDWQDDVNPEYFMRRVMAWWLECPVDYWKLDELERYAASRKATP
jgi:hypothetical protein